MWLGLAVGSSACGASAGGLAVDKPAVATSASAPSVPVVSTTYPSKVDDLATALPKSASLVIGLPAPSNGAQLGLVQSLAAATEVAKLTHLPEASLRSVIDVFDGLELFVIASPDARETAHAAAVARFRDAKAVQALISAAGLRQIDSVRWVSTSNGKSLYLAWLPEPRIAVVGFDQASVDDALSTLSGKSPPFTQSEAYRAPAAGAGFLVADLARLIKDDPDAFGPGSRVSIEANAGSAELKLSEYGSHAPQIGNVIAPSAHGLMATLPAGPAFVMDLSLRRRSGKKLRDLVEEAGRALGSREASVLADALMKDAIHTDLAALDDLVGDDLALGVYMQTENKGALESRLKEGSVIVGIVSMRDAKAAKSLVDNVSRSIKSRKGLKTSPGKLSLDLSDTMLDVEAQNASIVVVFEPKRSRSNFLSAIAKGKNLLGSSPTFIDYKKRAPKESSLAIYTDLNAVVAALGSDVPLDGSVKELLAGGPLVIADVDMAPSDKGLELSVHNQGSLALVGVLSSLGTYGVRTYLQESKATEAKNTVGAIARGATASYERELASTQMGTAAHRLCRSAIAVPSSVQPGSKFIPSSKTGQDFQTGDDESGWKCLRFDMSQPFYYQYDYRRGGNYKGPARGGPDPGPNGFEASAEGDLDGNGKTSLFTITGKIKPDGTLVVAPDIFISDELE